MKNLYPLSRFDYVICQNLSTRCCTSFSRICGSCAWDIALVAVAIHCYVAKWKMRDVMGKGLIKYRNWATLICNVQPRHQMLCKHFIILSISLISLDSFWNEMDLLSILDLLSFGRITLLETTFCSNMLNYMQLIQQWTHQGSVLGP